MEAYDVFKDLAIIIIFAKFFGILARKCKAPQVVGEIVAGLLIGPSVLGLVDQTDFIIQMAEIGVVLLMFSAGLGTDLKELLKTGPVCDCFCNPTSPVFNQLSLVIQKHEAFKIPFAFLIQMPFLPIRLG